MSALSAAAADEDGDTIRTLKALLGRANALCSMRFDRIKELELMLEAIGAGGVGPLMNAAQQALERSDKISGYVNNRKAIAALRQSPEVEQQATVKESLMDQDAPARVATVTGVDEYGPMLNWHRPWVDMVGKHLYDGP
jgi:uncharacterized protein YceH (UPF0502 family)